MKNNDVVILGAVRSPFGKFGGALKDLSSVELAVPLVRQLSAIYGWSGYAKINRVILGNVYSSGAGQNLPRQIALRAGLPEYCEGLAVGRVCTSSLEALRSAYFFVREYDETIAVVGADSMSRTPLLVPRNGGQEPIDSMLRDGLCDGYLEGNPHMGKIADEFAKKNQIERRAQDEYAFESYLRAYKARELGATTGVFSQRYPISYDEGIREPNLEKMRQLAPVFGETITAANASQLSDGAAALLVTNYRTAKIFKRTTLARIIAFGSCALGNEQYLAAPVSATEKALRAARMHMSDIDLFEVHEPFAVGPLYFLKRCERRAGDIEAMMAKMNVWGGSIAIGHPLGATGARLVVTLVHALKYYQKRYGLAVACNGGGEAVAVIIENLQR